MTTAEVQTYSLTIPEQSDARAAFSWSMLPDAVLMLASLKKLSPEARWELLQTTEVFVGSLFGLVKQDMASGALAPAPLPLGVDGVHIGGKGRP